MTKFVLKIYDWLSAHRRVCLVSFLALTTIMGLMVMRLGFSEDIAAFMSGDDRQQQAMAVYQDVSGAGKIVAIFQAADTAACDPDVISGAITTFAEFLADADTAGMVKNLMTEFDLEQMYAVTDFAYESIPYFLTESDYARIDSLLASPGYIATRLDEDKQLLMFPSGGVLGANLQKDPLNLFSPVVAQLGAGQGGDYELYDGHIFTADMTRAIAMLESPYGNSETRNNALLTAMLDGVADSLMQVCPQVSLHYIGGPTIAVENASQIKRDSTLSIAIALVLIVALLVLVFRRPFNILLIVVSVGWGWLFAMAMLSVIHDSVSLIVVGISSIILGIAVNYPLHLIAHIAHTQSMRQVLREIISPLVIGNVTTVGAFIALVPIKATALRDLGIFSAFILIGTIVFVAIYLPHIASLRRSQTARPVKFLERLGNLSLEKHRWAVIAVLLLTCVLAYYATRTTFDANMSHINYLTEEQRADMEYFKQFASAESRDVQSIYVVSTGASVDEALDRHRQLTASLDSSLAKYPGVAVAGCARFMPSVSEQQRRIDRWNEFVDAHREELMGTLAIEARRLGFEEHAFDDFVNILKSDYTPREFDDFSPLHNLFSRHLSLDADKGQYRIVSVVSVPQAEMADVKQEIDSLSFDGFAFDVQQMNSSMARSLSDNFNYIGWACGIIVFLFLWFSFSSIELAMLSFLPMAVSWIWIMGIMGLTGIQFNIVNIILATFIFGQGDDYTIFITEGCCYEYAYRKRMLASYKQSIIVSALIMFIGIGTLILAKHPALHSLAEVTIIGMSSVVLMAWMLPPWVFGWLTRSHGRYRRRPLTLGPVMRTWFCGAWWLFQLLLAYILGFFLFVVGRRTPATERLFHKFVTFNHRLDERLLPGVRIRMHNQYNEQLDKPCIIVSNHQSLLDPMFFMAWSPKIIIVANERSSMNPVVRVMFRWLGFYTIRQSNFTAWKDSSLQRDMEKFRSFIALGYSIAFFPEGERNPKSSVLRCHKGPFYLATRLGVDVLPVLLHGVNHLMPIKSFACYSGSINIHIGKRICPGDELWSDHYGKMAILVHRHMAAEYDTLCRRYETAGYYASLVIDRYRYKGAEITNTVRRNLKKNHNYSSVIDRRQPAAIIITGCGYGEMPLLMALVHPQSHIVATDPDPDKLAVARYAAQDIVRNLEYTHSVPSNDDITYDVAQLS